MIGGYPVEPVDIHARHPPPRGLRDFDTLTDKAIHAYSLGWGRIRDGIEIEPDRARHRPRAARARALADHHHQLELAPAPRRADGRRASSRWPGRPGRDHDAVHARRRDGAGDRRRCAGAAERRGAARASRCTQLVRPGAPVVYGGFTSNVDMKSGAPAFGTPEYMKAVLVGGQLARRYRLPYRTSNACAANTVDAQAVYESVFSLWAVVMGGGNFVKHAAGWLEGGLVRLVREDGDRRRHAADGGRVPGAARGRRGDPGAGRDPRGRPGRPFLRLRRTRRSATAPRSTRRWSPTGATTRAGARRARPTPRAKATASRRSCWPPTSRRRSTRRSRRSSTPSSTAGSARAARPASSDPFDKISIALFRTIQIATSNYWAPFTHVLNNFRCCIAGQDSAPRKRNDNSTRTLSILNTP